MDCRVQYQFVHSRQRFCYWIYKRCISSMNDECGSHCSEYEQWTIAVYVFHFNFSFLVPYRPRCKILIIHKSRRPWVWVCGTLALLIRDRFFLAARYLWFRLSIYRLHRLRHQADDDEIETILIHIGTSICGSVCWRFFHIDWLRHVLPGFENKWNGNGEWYKYTHRVCDRREILNQNVLFLRLIISTLGKHTRAHSSRTRQLKWDNTMRS